jgi:CIC family chloride channel protein
MVIADVSRRFPLSTLSFLAILVGIVTGLGAIVFRIMVAAVQNLFFFGQLSIERLGDSFGPPSPYGPLIILAPVIGGMGVIWIVRTFAPEAKGHGVPEVMDSIYFREGRIRPVVAVAKILASALSIGSGASVGREGPIIQIGSSFGSTLGQILPVEPWQRITLVAAGAGGGIAATFNTPLGGVLFAAELLLPEVSTRTFLPVVLATGTATFVGRLFLGVQPAFQLMTQAAMEMERIDLETMLAVALLGVLCGLGAWLFIRLLTFMEDFFGELKINDYAKHAIGMLALGVGMYLLMLGWGHYFIDGVGYPTVQAILVGNLGGFGLLLLLFVAKLLATTISLGSGSSGGVFAPSLFMGATFGGAFGALMIPMLGLGDFTLPEFAIVGMASLVAGSTGATMTAIVMLFEMTRDFHILFPAIIASTIAIGVRRLLSDENIYTIKLAWRGHHIPKDRHSNMFLVRHADDVMSRDMLRLPSTALVQEGLRAVPDRADSQYILVTDDKRIVGVLLVTPAVRRLAGVEGTVTLGEIADRSLIVARPEDSMFDIFRRMARRKARYVLVVTGGRVPRAEGVQGVIAWAQITDAVVENFKD